MLIATNQSTRQDLTSLKLHLTSMGDVTVKCALTWLQIGTLSLIFGAAHTEVHRFNPEHMLHIKYTTSRNVRIDEMYFIFFLAWFTRYFFINWSTAKILPFVFGFPQLVMPQSQWLYNQTLIFFKPQLDLLLSKV